MTDNIIRMNHQQYRIVQRLVHDCCNYDHGNCLALDNGWEPCVCVQSIDYSLVCKWFRTAVLSLDKLFEGEILYSKDMRPCASYGKAFLPGSHRAKVSNRQY